MYIYSTNSVTKWWYPMKTYLSIDLDYWLGSSYNDPEDLSTLGSVLNAVKHVGNTLMVDEHQNILDHINSIEPDKIIHIDFHQDIAYPHKREPEIELHCSNFFYYVNNRKDIDYEWFYPEKDCASLQHRNGLCVNYTNPLSKDNWIFNAQKHKKGLPPIKELKSVSAVGFAASRDYCMYPGWDSREWLERLIRIIGKRYLHTEIVGGLLEYKEIEGGLLEC